MLAYVIRRLSYGAMVVFGVLLFLFILFFTDQVIFHIRTGDPG